MLKERNKMRRMAAWLLSCLLLLLSLPMTGCGDGSETENGGAETTAEKITTEEETFDFGNVEEKGMTISGNPLENYRIIYRNTVFGKECASKVQKMLHAATGALLPALPDSEAEAPYEILVGKTNRAESNTVRGAYDRPNVYYTIRTLGSKMVIMGEGYQTLKRVATIFENRLTRLLKDGGKDLSAIDRSGDVKEGIDPIGHSVLERAEGTDLRVYHWNMAAPYHNPSVTPPPVVYGDCVTRGEVMADFILQMLPDIITTNEFYESHNGDHTFFNTVMGELGEYYTHLKSPYDVNKPEEGANAIQGKTENSNIIYRKDRGLTVVSSSWRYSTEKTTVTTANPGGWVYYHGSHTAVFSLNGRKFIVSVSHYADSRSDSKWAKEHLAAIADAQAASGSAEPLPVILTGDLYTGYTSKSANSGYKYLVSQGYVDSQRTAAMNGNNNIAHGTFHTVGVRQTERISEDFVWHTDQFEALAFKVLANQETDDTSDHYPVMADLRLKG
ncbi:MAG: hypothetical protein E7620_07435 [Ruminococcaceae bacterium]|nr:hypothetical protein [Oscillospiraceae bacterium]